MTDNKCQPNTAEAHLWDRLRQCQYNNEAAAARIHDLEVALLKISAIEDSYTGSDWCEIDQARGIARDALLPSVAGSSGNPDAQRD